MKQVTRSEKNREKEAHWIKHIESWKGSGLSQIDYCRENNLSRHRFTYWKLKNNKKANPVKFIPLISKPTVPSLHSSMEPLKVHVGDRYLIEVGEDFSDETLRRLINTLADM